MLNEIYRQLQADSIPTPIKDKEDLCKFKPQENELQNEKFMVDLCELVKQCYYDPYTKGSNSIKDVLPAILNSLDNIKEKYSEPIYGTDEGIKSSNLKIINGFHLKME